MSLFQHSVLNKYLKEVNQSEIKSAFEKLVGYFHNPFIQQNIRESKEEQWQEGFLTELFVKVLGYTINPNPDYNLTTEFKNERGAKKADGAILKDGAAVGVIELKSTSTKDLEAIRLQAFDYKANHQKCVYVITSNFEKIRFYINNAVDFEEFDLFKINYEQFQLLWLCLAKENLLKGIPLAIKEDSVIKEQDVTKKIYLDYTAFKRDLYNNLIENNLDLGIFNGKDEKEIKLLLFKKSQKLIDRFLFIFFGEDRGLLPPNSISEIIKQWENQSDWGDEVHLYDRYRKYFHLLNTGWKGKQHEIFAYNGGLFAPDEILDSVKISDEVLKRHTKVLTTYDFETEVDVNILGHIFENSLNEIEEVAAQIEAEESRRNSFKNNGLQPIVQSNEFIIQSNQSTVFAEKAQRAVSKRKKDGIFYTPKYITKYIVENTVGKLCREKKTELGIIDFDYDRDFKRKTWRIIESVTEVKVKNEVRQVVEKRKTNISIEGTKQLEILNNYRNWLLKLTICDPACGSGAFLNQALDFLITEHNTVTELTQKITGDVSTMFIDIENQILENNIYGVDINEESIEIAKLSLWLRTAQKGRKLTTLSNNIKCGNSLIDDHAVAGEKAFHWQTEFPDIFQAKEKKAWHVTWVTHDTRTSERMIKYKVRERRANGEMYVDRSIYLESEDAIKITEIISTIVGEEKYNCLAYNIGEDHIHILLVCDETELTNIVRKLKGKSAQKFKEHLGIVKDETFNLWAQKFDRKLISSEEQFANTIEYIVTNRIKHNLPDINKGLQPLVEKMTCTLEHAFRTEYTGGFDVVIGNPPYLRVQGLRDNFEKETKLYESIYKSATGRFDIYVLFIEKAFGLINNSGKISFILPHKFIVSDFGEGIRNFLVENMAVEKIVHFGAEMVFADASTYTCILCLSKNNNLIKYKQIQPSELLYEFQFEEIYYQILDKNKWNLQNTIENKLFEKLKRQPQTVKSVFENISQGVVSVGDDIFLMKGEIKGDKFIGYSDKIRAVITIEADTVKPLLKGEDVKKYAPLKNNYFCFYPHLEKDGKTVPYEEEFFKEKYPLAYNYIIPFKNELIEKKIRYKTNPKAWYSLHRSREISLFEQEKIVTPETSLGGNMSIDSKGYYHNTQVYTLEKKFSIKEDNKFWLAILNSSLFWYFLKSTGAILRGGYFRFKTKYLEPFPLPKLNEIEKQNPIVEKINLIITKTTDFQNTQIQFIQLLQNKFEIKKSTKKMQNWHELSFKDFLNELKKAKIKLTLSEEAEWMFYFNEQKQKAQTLKSEIDHTDREIDRMVYELYRLTEEEIKIVEENK